MNTNRKLLGLALVATLNFTALFSANTTWIWDGSSSTSWTTKANWTTSDNESSIDSDDTIVINSGSPRYPNLGSASRTVAKMVFNGGTLDTDGEDLRINTLLVLAGGTFTNSDNNSSDIRFDDLTINFSGSISLPSDIRLRADESVLFISGIVNVADRIEFADDATASGASNNSHIVGEVRKIGNDAFTFPIGDGSIYAPISISSFSNNSSSQNYTAEYFSSAYSDLSTNNTLDHVSQTEYWNLQRTGGTYQINVTLSYENPRSGQINNTSTLRVANYSGGDWVNVGQSTSGNNTSGTVATTTRISGGILTIGSSNALNPLPVKLLHFSAVEFQNQIKLDWSTSNEVNNHYFEVEKSLDGKNWNVIATVNAIGNPDEVNNYSALDLNPAIGSQFYRLKQYDFNGEYTYSAIVTIKVQSALSVNVFPNPATNFISISLDNNEGSNVNCSIFDINGKKVFESNDNTSLLSGIDISNFEKGIYSVVIQKEGSSETKTLLIQ